MFKGKSMLFWGILVIVIALILIVTLVQKRTSDSQVRIGSVPILTGEYKSYGEQFRDGALLAIKEINASDQGKKAELIVYDSEGNKDLALEKLKALKERDKIKFIADIMGSGIALNAMPYVNQNKMLVISGVNTGPEFTANGGPYFFRIIPSDGVASQQLAKWALELGYKNAAIVHATDVWGTGLETVLEKTYTDLGGKLVLIKDSDQKQTIFKPIVSELIEKNPDVIFLILYPREAGLFLKEAQKQGLKSRFMGTDNFTGSELAQMGGDAVTGVMFVLPSTEKDKSEKYTRFLSLYQKTYNTTKEPTLFNLMAYDCVQLLAKVIKDSKGDVEKAREILTTINYDGITGKISFDKNHDVVVKDYARKIFTYNKERKLYEPVDFSK